MKFKFTPSPTFVADAKRNFLAAFDARYPAAAGAPWLVFAARMLGVALAIAAIVMSGATVYADAANVPADSPLYPFKRLGEDVQLAVAPPQADASLQAAFAARRVAEISDLQDRHPTSTIIAKLSADADSAVAASISAADKSDLTDGQLTNLCIRLLGTLTASTTAPQGKLYGNLNLLDHFTRQCEGAGNGVARATEESTSTAPRGFIPAHPASSAFVTTTFSEEATTSEMVGPEEASGSEAATGTSDVPQLEMRIHDYLDTHLSSSSSLDLVNPTENADRGAVIELQGGFHGQGDGGEGTGGGGGNNAND